MSTLADIEGPVLIKNQGSSPESIRHHYDVDTEFYRLWLDPMLAYSCAFFVEGDSLEVAQLRKIDHHLTAANAFEKPRLLDIGCGWGGCISRAVQEFGVQSAVGLTLSPSQAQYIRDHYIDQSGLRSLEVHVQAWSDHDPDARYDAITSIGSFEHFARPGLSRSDKLDAYRTFFDRCRSWLNPGGKMSLQTVYWDRMASEAGSRFINEEIFPETDPPTLAEVCDAVRNIFRIEVITSDGQSYLRTLNEWRRRLRAHRSEAQALVGQEVTERYERYLGLCAVAFHTGSLNLARVTLRRID